MPPAGRERMHSVQGVAEARSDTLLMDVEELRILAIGAIEDFRRELGYCVHCCAPYMDKHTPLCHYWRIFNYEGTRSDTQTITESERSEND